MSEPGSADLRGTRFDGTDLTGARFSAAFATESWVGRCILGDPSPWHPLSSPWDEMEPRPGVPQDRDARPSLDEALALRLEAMALMRRVVDDLTEQQLAAVPRRPDRAVGLKTFG